MKEKCSIHQDKTALSLCHNCGKSFCSECLNEGKEFYYCNSEACLKIYNNEKIIVEAESRKFIYAEFETRLLAWFIDLLILFVANSITAVILQLKVYDIVIEFGSFIIAKHPMFYFSSFVYFVFFESSSNQATIGKKIMKIVVVDSDGDRTTISKAFIRNISKILSFGILLIGYFMIAFDKKRQALHDKIAKTYLLKLNNELLPKSIICNHCKNEIALNYKERLEKEFICPTCKSNNALVG